MLDDRCFDDFGSPVVDAALRSLNDDAARGPLFRNVDPRPARIVFRQPASLPPSVPEATGPAATIPAQAASASASTAVAEVDATRHTAAVALLRESTHHIRSQLFRPVPDLHLVAKLTELASFLPDMMLDLGPGSVPARKPFNSTLLRALIHAIGGQTAQRQTIRDTLLGMVPAGCS
jgi:hypothetical protein